MTTKRFTLAYADYDWWAICDKENPTERGISGEDVVELLNELHEENVKLKQFRQNVFGLIDKSLEKDKMDYEMTYEDYLNGRIEVLEDLKKELLDD